MSLVRVDHEHVVIINTEYIPFCFTDAFVLGCQTTRGNGHGDISAESSSRLLYEDAY